MTVRSVGGPRAQSAVSVSARVLDDLGRTSDAKVKKLDKDGDGKITEAELKPFMKKLEAATQRMNSGDDSADPTSDQAIAKSRALMKDSERYDLAIAQALNEIPGAETAESVSVKDLQKGVRKVWNMHVSSLEKLQSGSGGGLMDGLGAMFAMTLLPDAAFNALKNQR
ncbi:MAG: EF-hand domain-containing protein [Myxococcota bacterium]